MTNQSTAFDMLKETFDEQQAMMLANVIVRQINESTKDMPTIKDLEILTAKTDAKFAQVMTENAKALNRTIIWMVGTMLTSTGLIIAALKLLP